ncbi:hypothetical protein [uncultured Bacteroides sp.]|uniref:hypothetical protein n=1 Tax=uncultured Bacteroides sp. TaxID=162156 RepID=UPI002675BC01|nr:hypothetical protein [uncultured Bacteroides sp.]
MRGKVFILPVLIICFWMTGCVEKTGYYTEGENEIISLICDITWGGQKTANGDDGETIRETYEFRRDGTYTRTSIVTDEDGEERRNNVNGRWAFYNQSSNTICFGYDHYWDIEELTAKKFAVYDRRGEYGEMNMSREYKEFTPLE